MKTSELKGASLDWAVAKCECFDTRNNYVCYVIDADNREYTFACYAWCHGHAEEQALDAYPNSEVGLIEHVGFYSPSTKWSQGGPIIERENIGIERHRIDGDRIWAACDWHTVTIYGHTSLERSRYVYGPTQLVAAMRCYVASKLGEDIEIPEELK